MAETTSQIPIERRHLDKPPLEEIAKHLNEGLKTNFKEVSVEVVDCPNLRERPFSLAKEGLGGHPKVVELGGVPYLLPLVKRNKIYDLRSINNIVTTNGSSFIIGAGAGPFPYAGVNCEGIFNLHINYDYTVEQHSRISKVDPANEDKCIVDLLPKYETRVALLANLFFSLGEKGKVLKVHAKTRIGNDDFVTSIRKVLEKEYKDKVVGLGGAFLLQQGKAKQHVMRDFSETPINTDEELNNWLKFYNMSAPLIAVGTLVNRDPGLDLRLQHFHSFSHHLDAGHYHIDTTPEEAEYLGYFNTGEEIVRIDRPVETHQFGRD